MIALRTCKDAYVETYAAHTVNIQSESVDSNALRRGSGVYTSSEKAAGEIILSTAPGTPFYSAIDTLG